MARRSPGQRPEPARPRERGTAGDRAAEVAVDIALAEADLLTAIAAAASAEDDIGRILSVTLAALEGSIAFTGGSIALVEDEDLVIRAALGPFAAEASGQRLPSGRGRVWQVVHDREPFLSNDIAADGFRATTPIRSCLAVPLIWRGRSVGVLEVDSTATGAFRPADAALMQKVAAAVSGPIQLARRYAAEVQALAQAREAQRRLRVLAAATARLSSTLDYQSTLDNLARFAVEELCDWCMVNLMQDDGRLVHQAVAHADPARESLLYQIQRDYPPSTDSRHPVAESLRSGEPALIEDISDGFLRSITRNERHYELVRALAPRSVMVVPLRLTGHSFGAITFAAAESIRPYTREDLSLADEIARRAAVAIDNARMHQRAEEALAARDQALRQAEYERSRLAGLFAEAPAIICYLHGPDHIIEFANHRYLQMAGNRPVVGSPIRAALPEVEGQGYFEMLDRVYASGEAFEGTEMAARIARDGGGSTEGFFNFVFQPTRDARGDVDGILVHATEVTEQVLARRAVEAQAEENRRLNEELEQRVLERTAQLEAANKELESFSYSVSHDLRAPLRSIDGFSQALLEDYAGALDATGKDYLGRVRAASQRMAQLIDDLLNLSRVTRGELRREPVDLSALAREIAGELRSAEPGRDVAFDIQGGMITGGDPRLLRVVIENLFGNAWKFTSKRDGARIAFHALERDEGTVYVVRDNGAGFDMAYAGKLFAPFQRLHRVDEFEGSGIGLATVQRIVRRHGGRIWAEGAVGEGASFFFTLSP